jgi:hypothetical protein
MCARVDRWLLWEAGGARTELPSAPSEAQWRRAGEELCPVFLLACCVCSQGSKTGTVSFTDAEGVPVNADINGKYMAVSTTVGIIKVSHACTQVKRPPSTSCSLLESGSRAG